MTSATSLDSSTRFIRNIFLDIVTFVIALIPFWMWMGARSFLSPEGFFQEFFVFGIGVFILGGAQLVFFIAWAIITFIVRDRS